MNPNGKIADAECDEIVYSLFLMAGR